MTGNRNDRHTVYSLNYFKINNASQLTHSVTLGGGRDITRTENKESKHHEHSFAASRMDGEDFDSEAEKSSVTDRQ